MSRVRVYELAKEAGMGSKELADKLIAAGYEIKGHSSTVDDDTADKIRKTMFKKVKAKPETKKAKPETKKAKPKTEKAKAEPKPDPEAEKVDKRIEGEGDQKSTVIRRRTTIIRRRAKAEPEALEEAAEESAEQEADEALETEAVSEPADVAETTENDVGQEAAATLEEESETADMMQEAAEAIDEAEVEEGDTEAEEIAAADAPAEEDAAAEKEDSLKIKQPKKVERKKIAKVVGTIELPTPRERDKTDQQRPKRPVKRSPARPARNNAAAAVQPGPVPESSDRSRKKGKRSPGAGDENGDRRGKGFKKGKKSVKFTHFDADYQRGGRRGKRGKLRSEKKSAPSTIEMKASKNKITIYESISVGDLAAKMKIK